MLLEKITYSANDEQDFVVIRIGDMKARIGYRIGFAIDQSLRMGAKQMAELHGAPASFWRDVEVTDLKDCPKPHRTPRQSQHLPSCKKWEVTCNPPLVGLLFDDVGKEFDIELAVKIGHEIRRASRRAKAWAGDMSSDMRLMAHLTDANAPAFAGASH